MGQIWASLFGSTPDKGRKKDIARNRARFRKKTANQQQYNNNSVPRGFTRTNTQQQMANKRTANGMRGIYDQLGLKSIPRSQLAREGSFSVSNRTIQAVRNARQTAGKRKRKTIVKRRRKTTRKSK